MKREIIEKWANQNAVSISETQYLKMAGFQNLVLETNKQMNLTAIRSDEDFAVKHFIDSLTLTPYLGESESVCDIGSGAGFPGIVLAITRGDVYFTLIESQRKRYLFLKEAVKALDLQNVECINARAEELNRHFDKAIARAVAPLEKLVRWVLPLVKPGGVFLAMKGLDALKEVESAKKTIKKRGGEVVQVNPIQIHPDIKRNIIVIKKVFIRQKREHH